MPPLLGIVDKTLLRHRSYQKVSPPPLARRDGPCRGVCLRVGTVIAGAHVDAAFRRAGGPRRCASGVSLAGIEGTGIVRRKIDQREVDGGAGGMAGMLRDIAE